MVRLGQTGQRVRRWVGPVGTLAGLALVLPGCEGVMWINFALLATTVAIFVGTVSLGRRAEISRTNRDQSSEASRS